MFSFRKLVKETITVARMENSGEREVAHIAYGADNNFSLGTAVSAISVLNNNPDSVPHFHIFTDCVTPDFISRWQHHAQSRDFGMTVYLVDTDALSTLPVKARWPSAIYFRIVAIDYLADKVDRILYLDSDIVCCGDISHMLQVPLEENAVAACLDIDYIEEGERVALMNAPEVREKYFNSGLLLVNAPAWRRQAVSENIVRGLCDPQIKNTLLYYDQDLINIAVAGRIHFLNGKYNAQYSINDEYKGDRSALPEEIVFLHYIGATKPWHAWSSPYASTAPFLQNKSASPWCDAPLLEPNKKILWRHALKHARHQKRWSAAMKYGVGLLGAVILKRRSAAPVRDQNTQKDVRPLEDNKAVR